MAQLVSDSALAELRASLSGDVITPEHAAYDAARRVWNGAIDRRPAVVARPNNAAEVAKAIAFARAEGLEIAVRGGGHSFGGAGTCDDGLVIDLGGMRQVSVDPAARTARAAGGAQWGDVDAATQEHGLAVTGGFISHTGIGGLTLGGGMGWLTRRDGLTIDSLSGAEVVTADGRVVRASESERPDLYWALRGGGGNFGVVTEMEFRLHPTGPLCQLGLFFWTADRGVEALRFAREYVRTVPDDLGILIAGMSAPPAPFVPQEHQLAPGWALLVGGFGAAEAHASAIEPARAAGPSFEFVTPIPYTHLQQLFNEGNAHGVLAYEKAIHVPDLSDEIIEVMVRQLTRRQSPLSFIPTFLLDGAFGRVPDDATAFSGRRSDRYAINISATAPPGQHELYEADRAWVREFWQELAGVAGSTGSYVNFMSEYEEDRVRASYGAKYGRLQAIKREYDPDNVFHRMAGNIKPA